MIVPDVNLLLYGVNSDAPLHRPAREWLEETLSGAENVGLSWIVILAFLRLTTRAGIFAKPLRVDAAFEIVAGWLEQPGVTVALRAATLRDHAVAAPAAGNRRQSHV
jgi:predicted nucleic acid-binding protein